MTKSKCLWSPETIAEITKVNKLGDELQETINNIKKPKIEYVWVTYDPLIEKVLCVHRKLDSECDKCSKKLKTRDCYHLESLKFKIKD